MKGSTRDAVPWFVSGGESRPSEPRAFAEHAPVILFARPLLMLTVHVPAGAEFSRVATKVPFLHAQILKTFLASLVSGEGCETLKCCSNSSAVSTMQPHFVQRNKPTSPQRPGGIHVYQEYPHLWHLWHLWSMR